MSGEKDPNDFTGDILFRSYIYHTTPKPSKCPDGIIAGTDDIQLMATIQAVRNQEKIINLIANLNEGMTSLSINLDRICDYLSNMYYKQ